jgi:hypothetical protein
VQQEGKPVSEDPDDDDVYEFEDEIPDGSMAFVFPADCVERMDMLVRRMGLKTREEVLEMAMNNLEEKVLSESEGWD